MFDVDDISFGPDERLDGPLRRGLDVSARRKSVVEMGGDKDKVRCRAGISDEISMRFSFSLYRQAIFFFSQN